jgi:adenosine kinase
MSVLISGSLAFDTIFHFEGTFASQILPDQLHNLNTSFLVPELRREFGGCAGNMAYTLSQLGDKPWVMAALGLDGQGYLERLSSWGLSTELIHVQHDQHTACATIITDAHQNQITAFHPGAMQWAHHSPMPNSKNGIHLAIVGPNGKEAMQHTALQLHLANMPFIFDPGQGLPMFGGDELLSLIDQAQWLIVNEYEAQMLCQKTNHTLASLSCLGLKAIIVTLAEKGCALWQQGICTHLSCNAATSVVDPTGCGDAFRAGLLYGLDRNWPLEACAAFGNELGVLKVAHRGGQNHPIDHAVVFKQFSEQSMSTIKL